MRTVIQRVSEASIIIEDSIYAKIGHGLLILLGVEKEDGDSDIAWLINKIINLRVFGDEHGLMNKSITEVDGDLLVVSQFTLYASTKKGNRPSFIRSASPNDARQIYENFIAQLQTGFSRPIQSGIFAADMKVKLTNEGPVTIIIDTKARE